MCQDVGALTGDGDRRARNMRSRGILDSPADGSRAAQLRDRG